MVGQMNPESNHYSISDDPFEVDIDLVWAFLGGEAYWARWRDRSDFEAQLASAWAGCLTLEEQDRASCDGVVVVHKEVGIGVA
jgi:hypothetical protein